MSKLESRFIIFPELRKTLEEIQKYSPVAKSFLDIQSTAELPKYINYLGISHDNKAYISYLDEVRVAKQCDKEAIVDHKDLEIGDWIKLTEAGVAHIYVGSLKREALTWWWEIEASASEYENRVLISPVGISPDVVDYKFIYLASHVSEYKSMKHFRNPKLRYHTSCTKLAKKIFTDRFTEQEYSDFCSLFKVYHPSSDIMGRYEYRFVKGRDIQRWYNEERYHSEAGSLGNSCMRYDYCESYLQIYADNPDAVKLLIVTDQEDKLVGRSLVWKDKWFDRAYAISEDIEKGIIVHLTDSGLIDVYNKNVGLIAIELETSEDDYSEFPYMDTFKGLSGSTLYNSESKGNKVLNSSEGGYEGSDSGTVECVVSGDLYDEDDCIWFDHRNGFVYSEHTTWCGCIADEWPDDEVTLLWNGAYAPDDRVTELFDGEYAYEFDSNLRCSVDDEYFILGQHDEFVLIGEDYYKDDSDEIVMVDGTWYLKDDCYYSEKHGWTLEEMPDEDEEVEDPKQLKLELT